MTLTPRELQQRNVETTLKGLKETQERAEAEQRQQAKLRAMVKPSKSPADQMRETMETILGRKIEDEPSGTVTEAPAVEQASREVRISSEERGRTIMEDIRSLERSRAVGMRERARVADEERATLDKQRAEYAAHQAAMPEILGRRRAQRMRERAEEQAEQEAKEARQRVSIDMVAAAAARLGRAKPASEIIADARAAMESFYRRYSEVIDLTETVHAFDLAAGRAEADIALS